MMRIIRSAGRHPLIRSLYSLRGNQRACVYTEPLWGIPNNLILPFTGVYMYALGVSYRQIGLIASVVMFLQVFTSLLGGALTDKFGRRWTIFLVDLIAWSVPCLIWMLAQNFWYFLIAAALNSFLQISSTAWTCLMVEDSEKSSLVDIYTWIYISGQLVVFFAPVSAVMVGKLTVVPAMRILYLFAFISMTAKFVILLIYSKETPRGIERMRKSKNVSVFEMLGGYGGRLRRIFNLKTPEALFTLIIMVIFQISTTVTSTFFGLYATHTFGLPERYLAYFPIIRSVIVLLFMFLAQSRLNRLPIRVVMTAGVALYIMGHVFLIFRPFGKSASVILYILAEACAYAIFMPRRDSLIVSVMSPEDRPVMLSLMTSVMLLASMPFGYIGGYLSSIDARLPFFMNIILFALAIIILWINKRDWNTGGAARTEKRVRYWRERV